MLFRSHINNRLHDQDKANKESNQFSIYNGCPESLDALEISQGFSLLKILHKCPEINNEYGRSKYSKSQRRIVRSVDIRKGTQLTYITPFSRKPTMNIMQKNQSTKYNKIVSNNFNNFNVDLPIIKKPNELNQSVSQVQAKNLNLLNKAQRSKNVENEEFIIKRQQRKRRIINSYGNGLKRKLNLSFVINSSN